MKTKRKKTMVRTSAPKGCGRLFDSDKLLNQEFEFVSEGKDEVGEDYAVRMVRAVGLLCDGAKRLERSSGAMAVAAERATSYRSRRRQSPRK